MCAALEDFKAKCDDDKPPPFTTDRYSSEYADNIDVLATIKQDAPAQYHTLMHGLYRDICMRRCVLVFRSKRICCMVTFSVYSSRTNGRRKTSKISFLDVRAMAAE